MDNFVGRAVAVGLPWILWGVWYAICGGQPTICSHMDDSRIEMARAVPRLAALLLFEPRRAI